MSPSSTAVLFRPASRDTTPASPIRRIQIAARNTEHGVEHRIDIVGTTFNASFPAECFELQNAAVDQCLAAAAFGAVIRIRGIS